MQLMCYENASFPYILFKLISFCNAKLKTPFDLKNMINIETEIKVGLSRKFLIYLNGLLTK